MADALLIDHRAKLKQITDFASLIGYLRDEMDWPIDRDNLEDLYFEYTAEELGIESASAAKIVEIKRLRPLSAGQPWGIFFILFEPKRLPVVALRRILSRVVLKKRASANSAERTAWEAEDLLFVSNFGEGDERQICFAHFTVDEQKTDLPTLRVLGWNHLDTMLRLDDVAELLTERLAWPDDENDTTRWRERWRSAFPLRHREVITTSKLLAERLAELARAIRAQINMLLAIETEDGPLSKLMEAFREALVHDLDADGFADMYAQTIAYGLLSARIADPKANTADDFAAHMRTNPFLKELMETFLHVGGRRKTGNGVGLDFDELGVSEVVALLDAANMEAVLRDFGDRKPEEDPVIHFYELFLKEYDAKKRMQRGVFYTPLPVVSYIVRSVHELLQTEFGLPDGLADTATWGDMAERHPGLTLPEGVKPTDRFVTVLDPATGTGTFLVEAIDVIHRTLVERWNGEGRSRKEIVDLWNEYVPINLLPRLYGYELMMAPYAIAHLKIGLKLHETGYRFESQERARIYLTNALEPAHDFSGQFEFAIPALAHEAEAVNAVKGQQRFTIIVGNPPYSVSSWNTGSWITQLVEEYKRTVRHQESQIQSLSNDYIKFVRFAEWNIEQAGVGALGMVTGHGYLHGTQPRDMRMHLSETFDRCYCLDLHGSVRRTSTAEINDEPIFHIMTGVAIAIAFRTWKPQSRGMTCVTSVTGSVGLKLASLSEVTALRTRPRSELHHPTSPYFYFEQSETESHIADEYSQFLDLPQLFGRGNRALDKEVYWATGSASQQDDLAISFSAAEMEFKMSALADSVSVHHLREKYRLCTTEQWNYEEARKFAQGKLWQQDVGRIAYRPFDRRWTIFNKNVLTILRKRVMGQLAYGDERNLGLVSSRAVNDLNFAHCFVTCEPTDKIFLSSKTSTNAYIFPLFYSEQNLSCSSRHPNFSRKVLSLISRRTGLASFAQDPSALDVREVKEFFYYIYAILHSPEYRKRFAELLRIDFPRVPVTPSFELLSTLARLGGELVTLHLVEAPLQRTVSARYEKAVNCWCYEVARGQALPSTLAFLGPDKPVVEKVGWSDDTVWIDAVKPRKSAADCKVTGTVGFRGVPDEVWNFHIGGYQVCEKWLKDRRGRTLTAEDITHYHRIVIALHETIRIMREIDEVIEAHGGWPGAFATDRVPEAATG